MLEKIFNGEYLKRLDNIKQWQEIDVFNKESVAQHSYKVSIFCRVLLEDIFGGNTKKEILKFKLDCITYAMLHDWDEALILRDISHCIKYNAYNGEEIRNSLNHLTSHLVEKEFGGKDDSSIMLRNFISEPETLVKKFVKLCDWLALEFYVEREIEFGNKRFECTRDYCLENICKSAKVVKDAILDRKNLVANYETLDTLIEYGI